MQGRRELDPRPVDLGEFCRSAPVECFRIQSDAAGVALELDLPDHPVLVLGDEDELPKIINNLCSNAVKYAPAEPDVIHLDVDEEGPGVGDQHRPRHLPARTRSTCSSSSSTARPTPTRSPSGTGLGLAISRIIAEASGRRRPGRLRPGRGAPSPCGCRSRGTDGCCRHGRGRHTSCGPCSSCDCGLAFDHGDPYVFHGRGASTSSSRSSGSTARRLDLPITEYPRADQPDLDEEVDEVPLPVDHPARGPSAAARRRLPRLRRARPRRRHGLDDLAHGVGTGARGSAAPPGTSSPSSGATGSVCS